MDKRFDESTGKKRDHIRYWNASTDKNGGKDGGVEISLSLPSAYKGAGSTVSRTFAVEQNQEKLDMHLRGLAPMMASLARRCRTEGTFYLLVRLGAEHYVVRERGATFCTRDRENHLWIDDSLRWLGRLVDRQAPVDSILIDYNADREIISKPRPDFATFRPGKEWSVRQRQLLAWARSPVANLPAD